MLIVACTHKHTHTLDPNEKELVCFETMESRECERERERARARAREKYARMHKCAQTHKLHTHKNSHKHKHKHTHTHTHTLKHKSTLNAKSEPHLWCNKGWRQNERFALDPHPCERCSSRVSICTFLPVKQVLLYK